MHPNTLYNICVTTFQLQFWKRGGIKWQVRENAPSLRGNSPWGV